MARSGSNSQAVNRQVRPSDQELSEVDRRFGYVFACEGVVGIDEASRLLGGISIRTIKRRAAAELLRLGRHPEGRPLAVCRRSLREYFKRMEL